MYLSRHGLVKKSKSNSECKIDLEVGLQRAAEAVVAPRGELGHNTWHTRQSSSRQVPPYAQVAKLPSDDVAKVGKADAIRERFKPFCYGLRPGELGVEVWQASCFFVANHGRVISNPHRL